MKISSKYLNVTLLSDQVQVLKEHLSDPRSNRLCFLTAYGFVTGELVDLSEIEMLDGVSMGEALAGAYKQATEKSIDLIHCLPIMKEAYLKNADIDDLIGEGAALSLKNVKIYKDNLAEPVMSTNHFYLHASEIIGFFLGPL